MTPAPRFFAWWHARAPRERAMLAVMGAMLAAFAWWYGLLWPLRVLGDAAGERYDRAAATLQTARAEAAALATGTGGRLRATPRGEALQHHVLDSARVAGLAPSRQRTAADGSFVLDFERVASPALFGWLGELAGGGLAPSSLRVEPVDGRLRAEVGFAGAAP